ncbi:MAG: pyruvate formate-lyase-activating protein [Anaeroplasmataceae bacterium]
MIILKANIHSFESFGTVDGPGIRFVVFFKKCNLRCGYCHNPDTWDGEINKEYTVEEIKKMVLKYKNYYGDEGGVTVTGGEPLLQIDFVIELFKSLKQEGINTCVDTSGYEFKYDDPEVVAKYDELIKYSDLFLLDIKHIDNEKCIKLTGKPNINTLEFGRYLSRNKKHMWIRQVLVPGWTDDLEDLKKTREYIDTLETVDKVEVLPYHTLGNVKYEKLGIKYRFLDVVPPSKESVQKAKEILGV